MGRGPSGDLDRFVRIRSRWGDELEVFLEPDDRPEGIGDDPMVLADEDPDRALPVIAARRLPPVSPSFYPPPRAPPPDATRRDEAWIPSEPPGLESPDACSSLNTAFSSFCHISQKQEALTQVIGTSW